MSSLQPAGFGRYESGVHVPLARALGDCSGIRVLVVDRYSTEDIDGLEIQVDRHMSLYPDDPEVQEYRRLIAEGVFDGSGPSDSRVGHLAPFEIHHLAKGTRRVVTFAKVGHFMFLRVSLSATESEINREDGSRDNLYTVLLLSLLTHLDELVETRWGVDATRAARDPVNWASLMKRHQERAVLMVFAGDRLNAGVKSDRVTLKVLGAVSTEDDPDRRLKLVEAKVVRMQRGEACLAPELLPYGWNQPVNHRGVALKGALPVPDASAAEALCEFCTMFSNGDASRDIVQRLAELEEEGKIRRRSGLRHQYTFRDALSSGAGGCTAVAIVQRMVRPHHPERLPQAHRPSDDAIQEYLAGGDPAELFDIPQRVALSRIELLRSGTYFRVLSSDIRQRGLVLGGIPAVTFDPAEERGFFCIEAPWAFPIDPATGQPMDRFGIPEQVLRRAGARVLSSLDHASIAMQGGRRHLRVAYRPFLDFGEWRDEDFAYRAYAAPGARYGLVNSSILRRDASETGSWSRQAGNRPQYAVATFRQPALALAVADAAASAIADRTRDEELLTMTDFAHDLARNTARDEVERHRSQAEAAQKEAQEAIRQADGARRMAALLMAEDDEPRARQYELDAVGLDRQAARLQAEAADLTERSAKVRAESETHADADLSVTAYLIAGLRRGATSGRVSASVSAVAERHLRDWSLIPIELDGPGRGKWVTFTVNLVVPLANGIDEIVIPLSGRIPNIRRSHEPRKEPSSGPTASSLRTGPRVSHAGVLYFEEGLNLEQVSLRSRSTLKVLVNVDLRSWLRQQGMTNTCLITALIDHPLALVRQAAFEALTREESGQRLSGFNPNWRKLIGEVYLDPSMRWGTAACPDNLRIRQQVVTTLAVHGPVSVTELHRVLTMPRPDLCKLATPPPDPAGGFPRPRYVNWVAGKRAFAAIPCPHAGCSGLAAHAVLFPETAQSGFGVMCATCRRMPNVEDPKWATIVFPQEYVDSHWTSAPERPRPVVGKTVAFEPSAPADVSRFQWPLEEVDGPRPRKAI